MTDNTVFHFEFGSPLMIESLKALKRGHAVIIRGNMYWPVSSRYLKSRDLVVFKMQIDHTAMERYV